MIHLHLLHSLGKVYHEEALQEARMSYLEHRAKADRRPRSEEQVRGPGSASWLPLSGSRETRVGETQRKVRARRGRIWTRSHL